jgi:hypothetical protein
LRVEELGFRVWDSGLRVYLVPADVADDLEGHNLHVVVRRRVAGRLDEKDRRFHKVGNRLVKGLGFKDLRVQGSGFRV